MNVVYSLVFHNFFERMIALLQGICVDPGQSTNLTKDQSYFLFPAGTTHFYVSHFRNKGSHRGCFAKTQFTLKEKETWPEEPAAIEPDIDRSKLYRAKLIFKTKGYQSELKTYYLQPKPTGHTYFFNDQGFSEYRGSFPLHWFNDFEEVTKLTPIPDAPEPELLLEAEPELEPESYRYEQLVLF